MAVIGIITCQILELEFAKLLSDDADIGRITVLEDICSNELIALLKSRGACSVQCLPHPHAFMPEPSVEVEVLVKVLEIGLHRSRKRLSTEIANTIRSLQTHIDALVLGYGLCGGSLANVHSLLDRDIPLFQPMDGDHPAHDCVAMSLGDGDRYYREQRKIAGTYFLTPGWSRHWREMLDTGGSGLSQQGVRRLLSGYERALLVETPAISAKELQQQGAEFNRITGLRIESQTGTMAPLVKAWDSAKALIHSTPMQKQARGSA